MNEKLKRIQAMPIFPLPVVLVPGTVMPLHIFEPRYRAMLQHCLEQDHIFGLSYHPEAAVDAVTIPEPGCVGCAAEIFTVTRLPDGRSNVLVLGLDRYEIRKYERREPYLVARIGFFEDHEPSDPAELRAMAKNLRSAFDRFTRAAQILSDAPRSRVRAPEEPQAFSFAVAAAVVNQADELQRLIELRSTKDRLENLGVRLSGVVEAVEERAAEHATLRGNGQRKAKPTIH